MGSAKRRDSFIRGAAVCAIGVAVVAGLLSGCAQHSAGDQAADQNVADDTGLASDFGQLTWSEAFDALHARLSAEYAFTDWKSIDWDSLYKRYAHQVADAQRDNDYAAYYVALRSYLNEIPDGHVSATHIDDIDQRYIGGGFGLALARTVDCGIIASWVDPGSPAYAAGIRAGMQLISWNGLSAEDALAAASTVFAKNSATTSDLDWARLAYMVRAPVGTGAAAMFAAPDGSSDKSWLVAYDDKGASLKQAYPATVLSDKVRSMYLGVDDPSPVPSGMVEQQVLEQGIVYIRVWGELDADLQGTGTAPSTLDLFRDAVQAAIDSHAPGIIVDLRNNMGGSDLMAADMLGSFYPQGAFYEYANVYDESTGVRRIESVDGSSGDPALYIEPAANVYTGPVVALVNMKCVSSGEGVAMGISRLANGTVMGFSGTNGSFGLCGPSATMPGGVTVEWPSGQSLDQNKTIQLDSKNGIGGVPATVAVPMTRAHVLAAASGEDVELASAIKALLGT